MKTIHQITALLLSTLLIGCDTVLQQRGKPSPLINSKVLDNRQGACWHPRRREWPSTSTLDAVAKEATTGFNGDWGNSLAQGTYEALPSIVNTDDVNKVLAIWNPAAPKVNTQLVDVVSKGASAASVAGQKRPAQRQGRGPAVAVAVQAASNGVAAIGRGLNKAADAGKVLLNRPCSLGKLTPRPTSMNSATLVRLAAPHRHVPSHRILAALPSELSGDIWPRSFRLTGNRSS